MSLPEALSDGVRLLDSDEKLARDSIGDSEEGIESWSGDTFNARRSPRQRLQQALHLPWWKFVLGLSAVWGFIDLVGLAIAAVQAQHGAPGVIQASSDHGDLSWYCRRDCGKSREVALEKGCVWDELEFRFTHPDCINQEVQDDFAVSGPGPNGTWLYAIDVDWRHTAESHGNIYNGTNMNIIDSSQLEAMIHDKFTVWHSNLWHISHCLWYWRKAALSRFDWTLLPMQRAEEAEHSYHCTRMIINRLKEEHLTDQYKTSFSF